MNKINDDGSITLSKNQVDALRDYMHNNGDMNSPEHYGMEFDDMAWMVMTLRMPCSPCLDDAGEELIQEAEDRLNQIAKGKMNYMSHPSYEPDTAI